VKEKGVAVGDVLGFGVVDREGDLLGMWGETEAPGGRERHVALITEGCYPFVTGGVSTWCDQLIRGLPDHRFELVAITGGQQDALRYELPDNVTALRTVPLWGWTAPARPLTGRRLAAFLRRVRPFFRSLADASVSQAQFDEGLRFLFGYAQSADLSAALRSTQVAAALGEVWAQSRPESMSVHEVLSAMELLEHSLRPLSAPPIETDICHAVSNGLPSLLALTSKWAYGTPYVMSEHGVYLRERYLAFRELHCPWPVKSMVLAFFRRLTRTAYAEADVIAPVNVYNQRWQVEHGADPDVIVTAFNGVDAERYPLAAGEPDVPTIAWVGRVDPLKDLITLVDGFALTKAAVPEARLRLFGPTPPGNGAYEALVRARIAAHGLEGAVTLEGPISPVSQGYHAGHAVVLTSISEGLPYTVIEAMMCGRPTVSTEVGGVPEVVGDTGLLVPARDPQRLAEALTTMLREPDLRADFSRRGRERALTYFRVDQMLATFRGMYGSLTDPGDAALTGARGPAPLEIVPEPAERLSREVVA
jgi:glycosyltransferase involved in cell wall biosynthesis